MAESGTTLEITSEQAKFPHLQTSGKTQDGLGYSRHYAQKIRDLGKSSKESWIKRLWNHMFGPTDRPDDDAEETKRENAGKQRSGAISRRRMKNASLTNNASEGPHKANAVHFQSPDDSRRTKDSKVSDSDAMDTERSHHRGSRSTQGDTLAKQSARPYPNVTGLTGHKIHTIPAELANSPYLSEKDKGNYRVLPPTKNSHSHGSHFKEKSTRESVLREPIKQDIFMKKPSHPYLSTQSVLWRPKLSRDQKIIQMEKRAKAISEKAMKEGKIFACDGIYPVDAYLRFSLRKRGWVEKFGSKANLARGNNSGKLQCEEDEDFEAIIEQEVPAPWEEENGLYATTSRLVRHYPAKFIWGGPRGVNSLVVRSEVITNHFPKARFFSSKVLIVTSLKELAWVNNSDHYSFFPRCHLLNDEEKQDMLDDFQITAASALLKWVQHIYLSGKSQRTKPPPIRRENTKYEEVLCSRDNDDKVKDNEPIFALPGDDIVKQTSSEIISEENPDKSEENPDNSGKIDDSSVEPETNAPEADDGLGETELAGEGFEDDNLGMGDDDTSDSGLDATDDDGEEAICATPVTDAYSNKNRVSFIRGNQERVLPDLKPTRKEKKGGEIPIEAVELAVQACRYYVAVKQHEDLDSKIGLKRGLTPAQWTQLLDWFSEVSIHGATIPITEALLRATEEVLRQMRQVCPQYDLDGKRNTWIIKPGDKSKGIGIEFCEKVADVMKFITNPTTAGTYIIQKYIEQPLLIYNCKFDIRQWFLVTDWSPLTVWFYKDSYLRICSQEFSLDNMHETIHLSNVAVQQNYLNGKRDERLPDNNFLTSNEFKKYLEEIGAGDAWESVTYCGMKEAVINTLISTQDITEMKKSAFELYGADFMLTEDYRPYLLEINASPGMAPTSLKKARLCASVIDDTIKVVLDRKQDRNCNTGRFELIFRDIVPPAPKVVDAKLLLEGSRIKKGDLNKYSMIDQKARREETKKLKAQQNADSQPQSQQKQDENEPDISCDTHRSTARNDGTEKCSARDSPIKDEENQKKEATSGRESPRKTPSPSKQQQKTTKNSNRSAVLRELEKVYITQNKKPDTKSAKKK